jgi:quercetin dioxygenase-like cupin family protein
MSEQHDLNAVGEELLRQARESEHHKASRAVLHGDRMRAVLIAFARGADGLAEHASPPAATLQVLRGRVTLATEDQRWELGAGQLIAIPPARHSLETLQEESVVLLTVSID